MNSRNAWVAAACALGAAALFWVAVSPANGPGTRKTERSGKGPGEGAGSGLDPGLILQKRSFGVSLTNAAAGADIDAAHWAEARRLAGMSPGLGRSRDIAAYVAGIGTVAECAGMATNVALFGHELASAALQRWLELDPQDAIRSVALASRSRAERSGQLGWMLKDYSERDPAGAMEFVRGMSSLSEGERAIGLAAVLPAYARTVDAGEAVEMLAGLPSSVAVGASAEIFSNLAKGAAVETVKQAFTTAGTLQGVARSAGMASVLEAAAEKDPKLAVEMWSGVADAGLKNDLTTQMARKLGETFDPGSVVQWLSQYAPERGADGARIEAFAALSTSDPKRALEFLAGRPVGQQDDLREGAAGALEPRQAIEMAAGIRDETRRQRAITEAGGRLADEDPAALYQLLGGAKDPEIARGLLVPVVDALAYESADKAIQYVQSLPGDLRDQAASRLVETLSDLNPANAARVAASTIADEEVRVGAVGSALSRILDGAGSVTLPDLSALNSGERDKILAYASGRVSVRNPEAALSAAALIHDEATRSAAVQLAVLGATQSQSTERALQLLEQANVSEVVRNTIRDQVKDSGE